MRETRRDKAVLQLVDGAVLELVSLAKSHLERQGW